MHYSCYLIQCTTRWNRVRTAVPDKECELSQVLGNIRSDNEVGLEKSSLEIVYWSV